MNLIKSFNSLKEKISITLSEIKTLKETTNTIYLERFLQELKTSQPNSLLHNGFSVYSQNDEDGIIQVILRKINRGPVTFIEFGVDPCENNTSLLLITGGRGVWIDKTLGAFKKKIGSSNNLLIQNEFVKKGTIVDQIDRSLDFLKIDLKNLDFLSIDLDGNDYYFLNAILDYGLAPRLICVEYNAKFPLPLDVKMEYKENHSWIGNDYFSASLQAYINLLNSKYTLLCCNSNGVNAFFIRNDYKDFFDVYTPDILFMKPRYFLSSYNKGHKSSIEFLINSLR